MGFLVVLHLSLYMFWDHAFKDAHLLAASGNKARRTNSEVRFRCDFVG